MTDRSLEKQIHQMRYGTVIKTTPFSDIHLPHHREVVSKVNADAINKRFLHVENLLEQLQELNREILSKQEGLAQNQETQHLDIRKLEHRLVQNSQDNSAQQQELHSILELLNDDIQYLKENINSMQNSLEQMEGQWDQWETFIKEQEQSFLVQLKQDQADRTEQAESIELPETAQTLQGSPKNRETQAASGAWQEPSKREGRASDEPKSEVENLPQLEEKIQSEFEHLAPLVSLNEPNGPEKIEVIQEDHINVYDGWANLNMEESMLGLDTSHLSVTEAETASIILDWGEKFTNHAALGSPNSPEAAPELPQERPSKKSELALDTQNTNVVAEETQLQNQVAPESLPTILEEDDTSNGQEYLELDNKPEDLESSVQQLVEDLESSMSSNLMNFIFDDPLHPEDTDINESVTDILVDWQNDILKEGHPPEVPHEMDETADSQDLSSRETAVFLAENGPAVELEASAAQPSVVSEAALSDQTPEIPETLENGTPLNLIALDYPNNPEEWDSSTLTEIQFQEWDASEPLEDLVPLSQASIAGEPENEGQSPSLHPLSEHFSGKLNEVSKTQEAADPEATISEDIFGSAMSEVLDPMAYLERQPPEDRADNISETIVMESEEETNPLEEVVRENDPNNSPDHFPDSCYSSMYLEDSSYEQQESLLEEDTVKNSGKNYWETSLQGTAAKYPEEPSGNILLPDSARGEPALVKDPATELDSGNEEEKEVIEAVPSPEARDDISNNDMISPEAPERMAYVQLLQSLEDETTDGTTASKAITIEKECYSNYLRTDTLEDDSPANSYSSIYSKAPLSEQNVSESEEDLENDSAGLSDHPPTQEDYIALLNSLAISGDETLVSMASIHTGADPLAEEMPQAATTLQESNPFASDDAQEDIKQEEGEFPNSAESDTSGRDQLTAQIVQENRDAMRMSEEEAITAELMDVLSSFQLQDSQDSAQQAPKEEIEKILEEDLAAVLSEANPLQKFSQKSSTSLAAEKQNLTDQALAIIENQPMSNQQDSLDQQLSGEISQLLTELNHHDELQLVTSQRQDTQGDVEFAKFQQHNRLEIPDNPFELPGLDTSMYLLKPDLPATEKPAMPSVLPASGSPAAQNHIANKPSATGDCSTSDVPADEDTRKTEEASSHTESAAECHPYPPFLSSPNAFSSSGSSVTPAQETSSHFQQQVLSQQYSSGIIKIPENPLSLEGIGRSIGNSAAVPLSDASKASSHHEQVLQADHPAKKYAAGKHAGRTTKSSSFTKTNQIPEVSSIAPDSGIPVLNLNLSALSNSSKPNNWNDVLLEEDEELQILLDEDT